LDTNVTEIEIRDPDPSDPSAPATPAEPAPDSPYKNLLVPLVVVPALIVMVLVLVFVLFGAVAGKEDSPRENLDRLLHGGFNERKQAAFNLVRQVLEFRRASAQGATPEWEIDASFLPELRTARGEVDEPRSPKDVPIPLVLSSLLAQLGDPEGVRELADLTALADELDPEREYRMYAAMTLGALGPEMAESERDLAARALIRLLESPDDALVLVAIAGLQTLPSPETVPALVGMLASSALELRASAALSLAALGDPAGRPVLEEMLALRPYEEERAADRRKWPPPRVSESRCKALAALRALGSLSADALQRLAEDPDPNVRRAALGQGGSPPDR
jgi:HEAT repeat protein